MAAGDRPSSTPVPLVHVMELGSWSFYRALVAEFVAMLILMYVTVLTLLGYKSQPDSCSGVGFQGVSWASGGITFVLVYSIAGISGGHVNPAITFGLFLARKVSIFRAALYMVVQYLGAACGVAIIKALHPASFHRYGGGVNKVAADFGQGVGLAAEIVGTFVVVLTFLSATDSKRSTRDAHTPVLAPLSIGVAVFVVHLATIPITGAGMNPARSWGAAFVYNKPNVDLWLFWVGPYIGAAKAVFYHEYILGGGAARVVSYLRRK